LNCGAKSCPPVAFYRDDIIDEQLDIISAQFLTNTSTFKKEEATVLVTPLISWFMADFDGLSGAKKLLVKYGITDTEEVSLVFDDYDWTLKLFNFTSIQ
jgi:hypothetical protein